jgi:nitrous oxide reductase
MDMTSKTPTPISRRAFLGTTAAGATAAVAVGTGAARPAFAQQTGDERTRARYQATEHVETYYRTNRYYPRGTN